MKRFDDLLVVELAGSVAGGHVGRMFACLGARVLLVEPPMGDRARAEGEPLAGRGMGTTFAALHTGKESVGLNLHRDSGVALFDRLLARADVVIESASPGPLRPVSAKSAHERLVTLFISPFGLTGPYRRFRSTSFTDYAASGHMYLNGEPDREPIQGAGRQPEYAAGAYGFIGAMVALWAREETGRGQTVDVSHMEAMASLHQWTTVRYTHGGFVQKRIGNRYDTTHPITVYRCKDGYVAISPSAEEQGQRFLAITGLAHLLDDPRFNTGVARLINADAFDQLLEPWLMENTVNEIVELCQATRIPAERVPGMLELLRDPHLAARDFWQTPDGAEGPRYPGAPFRIGSRPWRVRPAPTLGSGSRAVLSELGAEHLDALRQAGAISTAEAGDGGG